MLSTSIVQTVYYSLPLRRSFLPPPTILNGQTLRIVYPRYEVLEGDKVIATGKLVMELPMVKDLVLF